MHRLMKALGIAGTALVLAVTGALAQAPSTILYQGRLADDSGDPVTGDTDVTFRIYDAPTAGTMLWEEDAVVDPNTAGLFTVELGGGTPFAPDVFDGSKRWLTMLVVSEGEEMTPRQPITAAPYAMRNGTVPRLAVIPLNGTRIDPGVSEVGRIDVEAPGPGFLHVAIRGSYWLNYDATSAPVTTCFTLGLCTESAVISGAPCGPTLSVCYQDADLGNPSNDTHAFVLDRLFPVEGGAESYFLNVNWSLGDDFNLYTHCNAVVWWYPADQLNASWTVAPGPVRDAASENGSGR